MQWDREITIQGRCTIACVIVNQLLACLKEKKRTSNDIIAGNGRI